MHRYTYTENIHAPPCELIIQTRKFSLRITHPVPAHKHNGSYGAAAGYAVLSALHQLLCHCSLIPNYNTCISPPKKKKNEASTTPFNLNLDIILPGQRLKSVAKSLVLYDLA